MRIKSEAASEQGHAPDFVTNHGPKVPICCHCDCEVPGAKSLWTLCEDCRTAELKVWPAPPGPINVRKIVAETCDRLHLTSNTRPMQPNTPASAGATYHAERLILRGIERSVAWRQAEAMVEDPAHRRGCEVCATPNVIDATTEERPW